MGVKGSKLTQDSVLIAELLQEKLQPIGGITSKKMFGGHGIFYNGKMFGMVDSKGQSYFKGNEQNKAEFEQYGSQKHGKMPYFSITEEILNDSEKLLKLANKTLETLKTK